MLLWILFVSPGAFISIACISNRIFGSKDTHIFSISGKHQVAKVVLRVDFLTKKCVRVLGASHPCQHLVLPVLNFNHSGDYEMISHCGFNLRFPVD